MSDIAKGLLKELSMLEELANFDIQVLQSIAHRTAALKGFWNTPEAILEQSPEAEPYIVATQLMNIVSELAEANEWMRKGNEASDHIPDFTGADEEFADTFIRLMDLAAWCGVDLKGAVFAKMRYNLTREKMHGKVY